MPSFLSRIRPFGKKKDAEPSSPTSPKKRTSFASLLDGQKFEAITKPESPSVSKFTDNAQEKYLASKEKDTAKGTPLLTLNLPDIKEDGRQDASLEAVFQVGTDTHLPLDWKTLAGKRLNTTEALALIDPCVQSVKSRGLETLGIMHPHWYSSSATDQRKILSYFFDSLVSGRSSLQFESELQYCRSPHDPAAVLRWGLRHLQNEQKPFGALKNKSEGEWEWYRSFANAERADTFPATSYSKSLVPLLAEPNVKLLNCIMDLTTALASQSELNGISGSKMCKVIGYWLLSTRTATDQEWHTFYNDWDAAGRILEHLFLAYLRDEQIHPKMPKRLLELVHAYPYSKDGDGMFLSKPRFSTRTYPALLVKVDIRTKRGHDQSTKSARRLVEDALQAELMSSRGKGDEYEVFFKTIQAAAVNSDTTKAAENGHAVEEGETDISPSLNSLDLSRIFEDKTLQLFELQAHGDADEPASPTLSIISTSLPPFRRGPTRRRSLSVNDAPTTNGVPSPPPASNGIKKSVPTSTVSPISTGQGTDWASFSTAGFFDTESTVGSNLAATLMDQDTEVSAPAAPAIKKVLKKKSEEAPPIPGKPAEAVDPIETITVASCSQTSLDEAFIDFWSDAITDPITSGWPTFALCQLKSSAAIQREDGAIMWLIIEARHSVKASSVKDAPPRAASPVIASVSPRVERTGSSSSRQTSATTKSRKLFGGLFGGSSSSKATTSVMKNSSKGSKVGELGEIVPEEEKDKGTTKKEATTAAIATAGGAAVVTAKEFSPEKAEGKSAESAPLPLVQEEAPSPTDGVTAPATIEGTKEESTVATTEQSSDMDGPPSIPPKDESISSREPATKASKEASDPPSHPRAAQTVQLPEAARSRASIISSGSKFREDLTPEHSEDEGSVVHQPIQELPETASKDLLPPAAMAAKQDDTTPALAEKTPVQNSQQLPPEEPASALPPLKRESQLPPASTAVSEGQSNISNQSPSTSEPVNSIMESQKVEPEPQQVASENSVLTAANATAEPAVSITAASEPVVEQTHFDSHDQASDPANIEQPPQEHLEPPSDIHKVDKVEEPLVAVDGPPHPAPPAEVPRGKQADTDTPSQVEEPQPHEESVLDSTGAEAEPPAEHVAAELESRTPQAPIADEVIHKSYDEPVLEKSNSLENIHEAEATANQPPHHADESNLLAGHEAMPADPPSTSLVDDAPVFAVPLNTDGPEREVPASTEALSPDVAALSQPPTEQEVPQQEAATISETPVMPPPPEPVHEVSSSLLEEPPQQMLVEKAQVDQIAELGFAHENGVAKSDGPVISEASRHEDVDPISSVKAESPSGPKEEETAAPVHSTLTTTNFQTAVEDHIEHEAAPTTASDTTGAPEEKTSEPQSAVSQLLSTLQTTAQSTVEGLGQVVEGILPSNAEKDQVEDVTVGPSTLTKQPTASATEPAEGE